MNQQSTPGMSLDARCVLDVLTEPSFLLGVDGRVGDANAAFLKLDADGSMLGRAIASFVDDETNGFVQETLSLALSEPRCQASLTAGQIVVQVGGLDRAFETKVLRATDESLVGLLCRQTLEDSVAKPIWREAVQSVGLGIWAFNGETGAHYASDVWRRLHQVASDTAPPIYELGAKDAQFGVDDEVDALKRQVLAGDTDKFEYRYPRQMPDGQTKWIRCRGEVQARGPDLSPLRVVGTENDVTAHYHAERALKQVTSKFELAIAAAEIGIFEFDPENHEIIWDDRMLKLYGVLDQSHRHPADFWETHLHPEDREDVVAYSDMCFEQRRDFQRDYRIVRPDGEVRWIRSLARYCDYGDGDGSLIGVNMDFSEDYRRQEALEHAKAQLEHDAYHDALTGLANRRLLDKAQAGLSDRCAVMHIDLDEFKAINDTMGHAAGDAVLVHVARAMEAVLPSACLRSRVGGDEFLILFSTLQPPTALARYAGALLAAVAEPFRYNGAKISVGCSIGIAISEQSGPIQKDVFVHADEALYQAKAAGRMQYRFYNAARSRRCNPADVSPQALRNAIDCDELVCQYQPQFDARSRRLIGAEALVRWRRPDGEMLPPVAFLPQAEALGLMAEIDAVVLKMAVQQLDEWKASGLVLPRLSVNISAATIQDENLTDRLAQYNLPADGLAFELLETIRLDQDDAIVQRNLACIVNQGIGVEIDDFGTAYASILSLQKIKPERLKIDRALLCDAVESQTQREIITAIIAIARSTGASVTAEGIESDAQADILTKLGCDILQGFALGRPMDADAFEAFALGQP